MRFRTLTVVLIALAGFLALPAVASAGKQRIFSIRISNTPDFLYPNGRSGQASISGDGRVSKYAAYDSDATDIVPGDTNNTTDVFLVPRNENVNGFDKTHGSPWVPGPTRLVSLGMGGQPANGPSTQPALDGDATAKAQCVAFVSEASNLVKGDTNGMADAFVYFIKSGKIKRVSVSSSGKQANGPTTDVDIDGLCNHVAFTTYATNLGSKAKTSATGTPRSQVYVNLLQSGDTILASASDSGKPGNADSFEPGMSKKGNAVVFASNASNLDKGDSNGLTDVYLHTIHPFKANKAQPGFDLSTTLVSKTKSGKAGNGPSTMPQTDNQGRFVVYESKASDITHSNVSQVVRDDVNEGKRAFPSSDANGELGNQDSRDPTITPIGHAVFYDTDATNLGAEGDAVDRDEESTVYKWYDITKTSVYASRDRDALELDKRTFAPGTQSSYPTAVGRPKFKRFLQGSLTNCCGGSGLPDVGRELFSVYDSDDPRLDLQGVPQTALPGPGGPDFRQAYLRYGGPCASTTPGPDGIDLCHLEG